MTLMTLGNEERLLQPWANRPGQGKCLLLPTTHNFRPGGLVIGGRSVILSLSAPARLERMPTWRESADSLVRRIARPSVGTVSRDTAAAIVGRLQSADG